MTDKWLKVLIFGPIVCIVLAAVAAWLDYKDVHKTGRQ